MSLRMPQERARSLFGRQNFSYSRAHNNSESFKEETQDNMLGLVAGKSLNWREVLIIFLLFRLLPATKQE